ncbi:MAG: gamma carbonic anhydrase family protein [Planctomycetota bacterium]|nr:gamma carbonic anhydrase family protein [Planctomycetota bacterium]
MIRDFDGHSPQIHPSVWIEPSADVIGEVTLHEEVSVWCQATIRGDVGPMVIGARTNIQDSCVVHQTHDLSRLVLGEDITVGHGAILHGCQIADRVLIGMGAIVMDNVEIASDCLVAAGSVLPPGKKYLQPGSMILGSPGRIVRALSEEEIASILQSAGNYQNYVAAHRGSGGQAEGAGDSWVR